MSTRMYLHVDLDAFFASVEILDNPELKGKPLIVGGLPGERRSVVSTCSYEARKYGVHSAMPISRAQELCPQAIFLHGRMERYHEKSEEVMSVFRDFSPDVLQMSIDEAFIDITGTERLFGEPEILAGNLKKAVFEKTGLTVSVGIATNRYVAKIASGLKKPDGLCYVPAGQEEAFMLSLPLDKLWGIGTKSRERLNGCGIFTIPEIHAISETALIELFGQASGAFLYKAVRGMDVEHFGDETKSRSMSAERTFCFDLSDIYSIETELLHLSYDVMFRVLKAKVNSKTVCLKIRYEDFTTVTVTESATRIVSSIEDLFERSCRLFHKKYERGRGIRLLGLGLQNVSDGLESEQGELFDFGEKKQRTVEKAVLKLNQKTPGTKLKKARQFITGIFSAFFLLGALNPCISATRAYSEAQKNIILETEGSWEALFTGAASVYFGEAAPVLSYSTPVLTQKADISLWFQFDDHWYFDAAIATDSDYNLLAAGYEGDGPVEEVRIGTDIGTERFSPGIKARFAGNGWNAGAFIHLDSIQSFTKTWKGSSELVSSYTDIASFKTGFLFSVINADSVSRITAVYVEDSAGTWHDDTGRTYKKLTREQYLLLPAKGLLFLENPSQGAVIAEISDRQPFENALPAYLKETADWFEDRGTVSTYSMMGITCSDEADGPVPAQTAPLFTGISGISGISSEGLYLSRPGYFSPFQVCSLYDLPVSDTSVLSVDSQNLHAESVPSMLLETSTSLVQLYYSDSASEDFNEPAVRYPAAKNYPWIYLPSSGVTEDIIPSIIATVSEHTDSISIGSQAIENSIQVLKNGVPAASVYDRNTGIITLAGSLSPSDTITVIWSEYSSASNELTLTSGGDFNALLTPHLSLSGNAASTLYLDSSTKNLSTAANEEPYAAISLQADWNRSFGKLTLSAGNTISSKVLFTPSSSKMRLLSFTGNGNVPAWILDGAFMTESVPSLSERPGNALTEAVPVLDEARRNDLAIESTRTRGASGYTLDISGSLMQNSSGTPYWYAIDIPLSQGASSLPSAQTFSLTLSNLSTVTSEYDIYLQLGIDASDSRTQSRGNVPTWRISQSASGTSSIPPADVLIPFKTTEAGTQTVRIKLTDSDRMKLEKYHDMRLIFVNRNSVSDSDIHIELSLGQAALSGVSFNLRTENSQGVSTTLPVLLQEEPIPSPFPESAAIPVSQDIPYAAFISWNTADASSGGRITAERTHTAVSLARWKKAELLFYIPEHSAASDITVNLLTLADTGWSVAETVSVTQEELTAHKGGWYILEKEITSMSSVSKIQLQLEAAPEGESGYASVYFGGVFLSEPVSSTSLTDEATAALLWESGKWAVNISANTSSSLSWLSTQKQDTLLEGTSILAITSPHASLSGTGIFDMASPAFTAGSLSLATNESFLRGYIGISEAYTFEAKADTETGKSDVSLSLHPLSIPFTIKSSAATDRTGQLISNKTTVSSELALSASKTSASLSVTQTDASIHAFNYLGSESALKKTENAVFSEALSFFGGQFAPALEIGCTTSSEKNRAERTGSFSQKVSIPFVLSSNRLSLVYERTTSSGFNTTAVTSQYADDILAFSDAFTPHLDSLSIAPVYDLFSSDIQDTLMSSLSAESDTSRLSYASSFTASWNRPLRADRLDFILPQSVSVTASRTLALAGLNTLDSKALSVLTTFAAFNSFGASSAHPVFSWYDQDEFQYSVRFTTGDNLKTELALLSSLYFEDASSCTAFYSGTISAPDVYSHTVQFVWNRTGTLFEKNTVRSTSGTYSIKKDTSAAQSATSAGLTHKETVAINEIFSINGSAALNVFTQDRTKLSVTLSIGGKMVF